MIPNSNEPSTFMTLRGAMEGHKTIIVARDSQW
eukprot:CAMPEP_0206612116 /NCGR_PEP_ID=MMETSP0325_2-20121206/55759_1 /ASSEMBLY_ACC=CAM_ASM_000347 /TAXON_ID=2866 /ORGANISM="Crypthecodinium cohnii, Strain Seligo" /LENGTH=32 /DNA_ID= /DNA_START= /DNA_END= /DNA_ORIENTATION=